MKSIGIKSHPALMTRVHRTHLLEATDRSSKKHLHGGNERGGFSVRSKEVTRWVDETTPVGKILRLETARREICFKMTTFPTPPRSVSWRCSSGIDKPGPGGAVYFPAL